MHSRANTEPPPPGLSLRQENAGSSEVFDKQKRCLAITAELMEELQSHPKPNEVNVRIPHNFARHLQTEKPGSRAFSGLDGIQLQA